MGAMLTRCPCSLPLDARGKCASCDSARLRKPHQRRERAVKGAAPESGIIGSRVFAAAFRRTFVEAVPIAQAARQRALRGIGKAPKVATPPGPDWSAAEYKRRGMTDPHRR